MLQTKFRRNRPTGSWKCLYLFWDSRHFDYVTSIMLMNFQFLVPESLPIKFGWKRPMVSEKAGFNFNIN